MKKLLVLACVTGVTLSSFTAFAGGISSAPIQNQGGGLRNEDYGNKPSDSRAPASTAPDMSGMGSMTPEQLRQAKEAVEALRKAQQRQQQALDNLTQD